MSVTIFPLPAPEKVRMREIVPGDWVSDGRDDVPVWHQVIEIDPESALIGDTRALAVVLPVDPDGWILRLRPEDRPRTRW